MSKNTVADAYVNLIPSAEGFSNGVAKAIDEGASSGSKLAMGSISNIAVGFAQGIGQAAFNAVGELGNKAVEVAKSSIDSYKEYEQLIGGVETLFGDASSFAMSYAEEAYKSAGLSANEYMEAINGMAAALNQVTDSEYTSAYLANQAVIDMADNANKMGTSMESIQNAYAGFTKQNFTMLDNLKLGYGGTKGEMERLLADATKLSGVEYDLNSYADIVKAIHVIQEEMGIAGTTQKEAASTIQGSLSMVQGAWQNLLTGIANEDANLDDLFKKLVDSIFGENGEGGFLGNLLPRIEQVINGLGTFILTAADRMPGVIEKALPKIQEIIKNVALKVVQFLQSYMTKFPELLQQGVDFYSEFLPMIIDLAIQLITGFAESFAEMYPIILPATIDLMTYLINAILANLPELLNAAIILFTGFMNGMISMTPNIISAVIKIIVQIVWTIIELIPTLIVAAIRMVTEFLTTAVETGLKFLKGDFWMDLLESIAKSFTDIDWAGIGDQLMNGIKDGILAGYNKVKNAVSETAEGIKTTFADIFKIESPSKVFKWYGEMINEGLALGLEDDDASVNAMAKMSNNVEQSFNPAVAGAGAGNIVIPVYIGNNVIETIVVDALNAANYKSGGR